MGDSVINSERVNEMFHDSLYREEEVVDGKEPEGCVPADGIVINVGFHPQRLEAHREEVRKYLAELPDAFHVNKGGGMSFLMACNDRRGNQWTDLHQRMEQLFQLGIGLGLAKWVMERSFWALMPGGMPYVQVDLGPAQTTENPS